MADVLEIEGASAFRVRAYRTAARTVEDLGEPIEEIVHPGHLATLQALARQAPRGAVELMRVPGLGPKRARVLCESLGVRSLSGLGRAAHAGRRRTAFRRGDAPDRQRQ